MPAGASAQRGLVAWRSSAVRAVCLTITYDLTMPGAECLVCFNETAHAPLYARCHYLNSPSVVPSLLAVGALHLPRASGPAASGLPRLLVPSARNCDETSSAGRGAAYAEERRLAGMDSKGRQAVQAFPPGLMHLLRLCYAFPSFL